MASTAATSRAPASAFTCADCPRVLLEWAPPGDAHAQSTGRTCVSEEATAHQATAACALFDAPMLCHYAATVASAFASVLRGPGKSNHSRVVVDLVNDTDAMQKRRKVGRVTVTDVPRGSVLHASLAQPWPQSDAPDPCHLMYATVRSYGCIVLFVRVDVRDATVQCMFPPDWNAWRARNHVFTVPRMSPLLRPVMEAWVVAIHTDTRMIRPSSAWEGAMMSTVALPWTAAPFRTLECNPQDPGVPMVFSTGKGAVVVGVTKAWLMRAATAPDVTDPSPAMVHWCLTKCVGFNDPVFRAYVGELKAWTSALMRTMEHRPATKALHKSEWSMVWGEVVGRVAACETPFTRQIAQGLKAARAGVMAAAAASDTSDTSDTDTDLSGDVGARMEGAARPRATSMRAGTWVPAAPAGPAPTPATPAGPVPAPARTAQNRRGRQQGMAGNTRTPVATMAKGPLANLQRVITSVHVSSLMLHQLGATPTVWEELQASNAKLQDIHEALTLLHRYRLEPVIRETHLDAVRVHALELHQLCSYAIDHPTPLAKLVVAVCNMVQVVEQMTYT